MVIGFSFLNSKENENKISIKDTNRYIGSISSLILYPEILKDEKERNYFETVKKSIESVVQNNYVGDVLDIFKNTQGYDDIFNKIRSNFDSNEEFDRCLLEFNDHFNKGIGIFKEALKNGVNKNPHLTGDTSNTATVLNFNRYFSVENLKRKTKNEQIILMNKILKGKIFAKGIFKYEHF